MNNNFIDYIFKTHVGNKRPVNEDFYGHSITPNGVLYIVCDGMGGHVGGAIASKLAVESLINYFNQEPFSNIFIALSEGIKYANQEIYNHSLQNPELKGMGTTCTILIAREPEVFIAHVGDSRIYIHSKNNLYRITKDHSFVQGLVDEGIISDEEMETHPKKNQILKALGIHENVEPTVYSCPIQAVNNDKFLLCSDGLNGEINDKTIESIINSNLNLDKVSDDLINAALNAGGNDNITLSLLEVLNSPYKVSEFPNYNPAKKITNVPIEKETVQGSINKSEKKALISKIVIINLVVILSIALAVFVLFKKGIFSIKQVPVLNEENDSIKSIDIDINADDTLNNNTVLDLIDALNNKEDEQDSLFDTTELEGEAKETEEAAKAKKKAKAAKAKKKAKAAKAKKKAKAAEEAKKAEAAAAAKAKKKAKAAEEAKKAEAAEAADTEFDTIKKDTL